MRAVFFLLFLLPFIIPALADDALAAAGDITAVKTQAEGNNLEHDTEFGFDNSLVQVDSDTYAVAYQGAGVDGFITTFTISADGSTITKVDSLEHDTTEVVHNSLVQVDSDTYALAYTQNSSADGYISTFTIDSDGNITAVKTQSEGNNLEYDAETGTDNSLVQVDSDTYALAYRGSDFDGFISTFTISADGSTITEVDSLEHDTERGAYPSIVQVDSVTYAVAYSGSGGDGFISTFTIDSDGDITAVKTQSEGNNLEHDTNKAEYNSLVQVDSDTYAVAYAGWGDDGFISTFTISADDSADDSTDDSTSTESKKRSGACGFDRDCTAPRITKHGISETPDGFSINSVIFEENQKFYNENPTVEIGIGELTTIKARAWENMGPEKIFLAIAYLDMQEAKPNWQDSEAYIEYDIRDDSITIHDENKLFLAQASTEIVKDPYGDNQGLEFLDITFSLMFTKPMETSHVAIQVVDHIRNYELVYFKDALKVVDRPISEMPEFPGKIEKVDTIPKQDEDIHFVFAVNGTEDTIFAAVDGLAIPIEELNKEEPKIETPEERDARYHLKVKQSDQYEKLLEYIAESQALHPEAWDKIVGTDNVSNQMEHVTDGTKTNVIKNDRRR